MMMTSSIAPTVVLPRMNAADTVTMALALMNALKTRVDAQADLPPVTHGPRAPVVSAAITEAGATLGLKCAALSTSCSRSADKATRSSAIANRAERRSAHLSCQRAWSAVQSLLNVWRETNAFAVLTDAQRASFDQLFADGVGVDIKAPRRSFWMRSTEKIAAIDEAHLGAVFALLGGSVALSHLRSAHAALSAALGITALVPQDAPPSDVLVALGEAQSAMRQYVIVVYAAVDSTNAASVALGKALLAPLLELAAMPRATQRKKSETPAQPVAPTPVVQRAANDTAPVLRPTGTG